MELTIITTPEIDVVKLRETAADLLESLVHGDSSPFKDMKDILEEYLDNAPDLDATQKAGIFADTLKSMYKDVNNQVLDASIAVLKTNGTFELEKYNTQGSYNQVLTGLPKIEEEVKLVAAQVLKLQKETELLTNENLLKEAQVIEIRAKLKKQYGVIDEVTYQLSDDVNDIFLQFSDGIWYKTNGTGDFVDSLDVITITPDVDGVPAEIKALTVSSTLANTANPGAIDKQIRGYDMVNIKDTLKTMDERAALMQNAKVPETVGEKMLRKELIEVITGATIVIDGSGNITSVSDITI